MKKFDLVISEFGQEVISYSDSDKDRFLDKCKKLIDEHLSKYSCYDSKNVKNIQIHISTFQ